MPVEFDPVAFGKSPAAPWGHNDVEHGLTKRELFAAMAMQGLLSCDRREFDVDDAAHDAVVYADRLIAELCKQCRT